MNVKIDANEFTVVLSELDSISEAEYDKKSVISVQAPETCGLYILWSGSASQAEILNSGSGEGDESTNLSKYNILYRGFVAWLRVDDAAAAKPAGKMVKDTKSMHEEVVMPSPGARGWRLSALYFYSVYCTFIAYICGRRPSRVRVFKILFCIYKNGVFCLLNLIYSTWSVVVGSDVLGFTLPEVHALPPNVPEHCWFKTDYRRFNVSFLITNIYPDD